MTGASKISIIIPVYYNADSLPALYEDMRENLLPKLESYEIVMVDDGSEDDSWNEMVKISQLDRNVKLVKLSRNFGSHSAILAGLAQCQGDCATIKTADLQESSEIILDMFNSWRGGNKVVLAVRSDRDEGFSQKLFASAYYWLVRKAAFPRIPKTGFDCYLIDRKVIDVLTLLDETNSALTLQILWSGFKTDTIYYVRKKRKEGKSRWTWQKKIKLVVDSLVSFSFFPIRFMSIIGFLFFVISLIWAVVIILNKFFGGIDVQGWTTIIVIVLFSSGLIMLTLGVLGEYVWRTMDAARNRPVYIIDEVRKSETGNK